MQNITYMKYLLIITCDFFVEFEIDRSTLSVQRSGLFILRDVLQEHF